MTQISIVVAVAENGIIGAGGDMPWRLSTDLKRFKSLTLGKVVLMGRKTFEAIGSKPLVGPHEHSHHPRQKLECPRHPHGTFIRRCPLP